MSHPPNSIELGSQAFRWAREEACVALRPVIQRSARRGSVSRASAVLQERDRQSPAVGPSSASDRPLGRLLETVLDEQVQVVALVEDLASDVRIERRQPPHLAVLLGHELLVEGRDLDVEVELGQVEVR